MTDFVTQVKEHANIAEVVGEHVRLKKTGSNYMGLCPFHGERSPSFSVSEKKQIYHCFGCQRGGDVISFLQELQSISFHEAVRTLATKYALKLPPEFASRRAGSGNTVSEDDRNEVYFKLNRFVAQFYHEKLQSPEGEYARQYLVKRGVSEKTIKHAYLGYAPADWAELYDFLDSKKAPLDKAEELGLIRRKSTGVADSSGRAHYDLFRDRLMFPVTDSRGRVIAFGGRALGDSDGPKYLNSSESPVFKKGNHLFGLFHAQKDIRAEDLCVVVEGFMDCLSLQQAGIGYAVATLGTALTARQIGILKRFTKNIVVLFDGDAAGKEAQARAMESFLDEDIVVRGVSLPDELDPDEFVAERGADALSQLLKTAPFLLDQRILELMSQAGAHAESRAQALDQVLPWVAKVSSETARIFRIQELSGFFDVKTEVLERRVDALRKENSTKKTTSPATRNSSPVAAVRPAPIVLKPQARSAAKLDVLDTKLIESLVRKPSLGAEIADVERMLDGVETESTRKLTLQIIAAAKANPNLGSEILEWAEAPALKSIMTAALVGAEQTQDKELTPEAVQEIFQDFKSLEAKLIRRGLERRRDSLRAIILKADGSGQSTELSKLMTEYNELVKRLDETKGGQVNI